MNNDDRLGNSTLELCPEAWSWYPYCQDTEGKKRYPKQMSQAAMPLSQLSIWVVLGKSLSLPASVFSSIKQELLLQTCKVNELLFSNMLKTASLM